MGTELKVAHKLPKNSKIILNEYLNYLQCYDEAVILIRVYSFLVKLNFLSLIV